MSDENVKTWKPNYGCKECKEAEKMMEQMTRMRQEGHGIALSKIKEQAKEIVELRAGVERIQLIDRLRSTIRDKDRIIFELENHCSVREAKEAVLQRARDIGLTDEDLKSLKQWVE